MELIGHEFLLLNSYRYSMQTNKPQQFEIIQPLAIALFARAVVFIKFTTAWRNGIFKKWWFGALIFLFFFFFAPFHRAMAIQLAKRMLLVGWFLECKVSKHHHITLSLFCLEKASKTHEHQPSLLCSLLSLNASCAEHMTTIHISDLDIWPCIDLFRVESSH